MDKYYFAVKICESSSRNKSKIGFIFLKALKIKYLHCPVTLGFIIEEDHLFQSSAMQPVQLVSMIAVGNDFIGAHYIYS